jgi:hypothetical protein
LLNGNVNHPVVAGGDLAGQRVSGDHGREDRAQAHIQQANAALSLVNSCDAKLGETVNDVEGGAGCASYDASHGSPLKDSE